jgi:hypothetical protein
LFLVHVPVIICSDIAQVYLEKKKAHEQYFREQEMQQKWGQDATVPSSPPPLSAPPPLPANISSPPPRPPVPPRKQKAVSKQAEDLSEMETVFTSEEMLKMTGAGNQDSNKILSAAGGGGASGVNPANIGDTDLSLSFITGGDFSATMERFSEQKRIKEQQIDGADLLYFIKVHLAVSDVF